MYVTFWVKYFFYNKNNFQTRIIRLSFYYLKNMILLLSSKYQKTRKIEGVVFFVKRKMKNYFFQNNRF